MHGRGVNGLGLVRSLGRNGVPTYVVGIAEDRNLAEVSRYCLKSVHIKKLDGAELYEALTDLSTEFNSPSVLYLDSDKMMIELARFAMNLSDKYRFTSPLQDVLRLTDKIWQFEMAHAVGLNVPRTWQFDEWSEFERLYLEFSGRVIAKPSPTEFSPDRMPFKIIIADDALELRKILEAKLELPGGIIIQQFIEGPDSSVHVAMCYRSHTGHYLEGVTGVKTRQSSVGGGVMAVGTAVDIPEVREMSLSLLSAMDYHGIIELEFKYCSLEKKYYFIEFNPRAPQFNLLSCRTGFDLAMTAYSDVTGGIQKTNLSLDRDRGHCWIYFQADVFSALAGGFPRGFRAYLHPYQGEVEWAVLARDDLRPWFREVGKTLAWLAGRILHRLGHLFPRSTYFFRWNTGKDNL